MNIYFVIRWGNPEDGPDGYDTNFLVNAESVEEAARLADERISHMREVYVRRPVADFTNCIRLLGEASTNFKGVLTRHFVMPGIVLGNTPCWHRDKKEQPWELYVPD
jgi:hypothetical protein